MNAATTTDDMNKWEIEAFLTDEEIWFKWNRQRTNCFSKVVVGNSLRIELIETKPNAAKQKRNTLKMSQVRPTHTHTHTHTHVFLLIILSRKPIA